MKSVLSRTAVGRRVVPGTVLALAAATLSLGFAGAANAAQPVELHGTVIDANGTPLANAYVEVDNAADENDTIDSTTTDANGNYSFDTLPAGAVKVFFAADDPSVYPITLVSPLPHQVRWSGGSRFFKGAAITNITVDPATAPVVNGVLPQYASVIGTVRAGADGHVPTNNVGTWADDSDENGAVWDGFMDDTTGNYRLIVDPSTPVRVGAYGSDTGSPSNLYYLDQYWQDADTLASATPINVAPGQNVTGINFRLTNALRARQAPSVSGYPTVGLPLTANPGSWSRNADTEFSYSWLRNGAQVGTGATYVPTAADLGQKLSVVVTALNGDYTGQSSTVTSDVVKWGATEKAGAKAKAGRKVAVHVKLVSAHQKPVKGKVVVMRGTKVLKAVKLVKGKVSLVLKNQPKGQQTYTVHFKGNKKIAQVDKTFTVRVHK